MNYKLDGSPASGPYPGEQEQMIQILVDKGHSREYAEAMVKVDLEFPEISASPMFDCSICRGTFTPQEWRYHYHPCE